MSSSNDPQLPLIRSFEIVGNRLIVRIERRRSEYAYDVYVNSTFIARDRLIGGCLCYPIPNNGAIFQFASVTSRGISGLTGAAFFADPTSSNLPLASILPHTMLKPPY